MPALRLEVFDTVTAGDGARCDGDDSHCGAAAGDSIDGDWARDGFAAPAVWEPAPAEDAGSVRASPGSASSGAAAAGAACAGAGCGAAAWTGAAAFGAGRVSNKGSSSGHSGSSRATA